jgi:hypothetical protein
MEESNDREQISQEWDQLCAWLRTKANEAIAASNDAAAKSTIETELAKLCRDRPPTKSLLTAWQSVFNEVAEAWETRRGLDQVVRKLDHEQL